MATDLSTAELLALAFYAGFRGNSQAQAVSIAKAESGGNPASVNPGDKNVVGLMQINLSAHPTVTRACALNPVCAMKASYTISDEGTNFDAWQTYTGKGLSGAPPYLKYMPQTQQAQAENRWTSLVGQYGANPTPAGAGSGGAAAAAGSGQAASSGTGSSATGAGGSGRRLFDCGGGTSIPLASFSIPPVGCYVVDALVFMGYAVGGLLFVGAGALLMMKTKATPAAALKSVVSPAGGAFTGAAKSSLDRAEQQGNAQAQAGKAEAAQARTQTSETYLAATRRAQLRTSRARARKTEAEARSAKQNVGTSYSLSPNAERALSKARKSPPRGRPDRMA